MNVFIAALWATPLLERPIGHLDAIVQLRPHRNNPIKSASAMSYKLPDLEAAATV